MQTKTISISDLCTFFPCLCRITVSLCIFDYTLGCKLWKELYLIGDNDYEKMLQKLMILMLIFIMMVLACVMPTSAAGVQSTVVSAQTENPETDFACVHLSNDTIEIAGYTETATDVVIPSVVDGKMVLQSQIGILL